MADEDPSSCANELTSRPIRMHCALLAVPCIRVGSLIITAISVIQLVVGLQQNVLEYNTTTEILFFFLLISLVLPLLPRANRNTRPDDRIRRLFYFVIFFAIHWLLRGNFFFFRFCHN